MTELRPRSLGEILDAALTLALRGAIPSLRAVAIVMTPFVLLDVGFRWHLSAQELPRWAVVENLGVLALMAPLALFILDVLRSIAVGGSVSTQASCGRALRACPLGLVVTELLLGSFYLASRSFWAWIDTDKSTGPVEAPTALGIAAGVLVLSPIFVAWIVSHYAWGWTLSSLIDSKKRPIAAAFSGSLAIVRRQRRRVFSEMSFTFGLLLVSVLATAAYLPSSDCTMPATTFVAVSAAHIVTRGALGLYFLAFIFLSRRDAAIRSEGLDLDVELARLEAAT